MQVHVGIAKRRAKRLAAAVMVYSEDLDMWHVLLYTVVDGKVAPFAEQAFDTQQEATDDVCENLKIEPEELLEMDEEAVDDYILKTTRNKWSTS
ncbi:MAG: hypothetical protein JWP89_1103 [Schlesneria sp.]|nr:hypothetical protein [Schlesneria sp.]